MSYAPTTLLAARSFYIDTLKLASYRVDPLSVGIVGDDSHASAGTGYHLGEDALRSGAYSVVESPRDRKGLTDAAAALDLGWFDITVHGKRHTLRTFSVWLVAQCKANTADTADLREVIYSPDGRNVKRWDRLGRRTTGDKTHLTHTHESWFRDSEKRDKTAHLRRYFTEIGLLEDDVALTTAEINSIAEAVQDLLIYNTKIPDFASTAKPQPQLNLNQWFGYSEGRRQVAQVMDVVRAESAKLMKAIGAVDVDEAALSASVVSGVLAGMAATDGAADTIADAVVAALPADLATDVANQILAKQGQAMVAASGTEG